MRLVLITLIKKSLLFLKNEKSFASYEKENFARRFQVSNVILRFLITVTLDAADPDIALPIAKIELFFVYYSSQSLLPFTPLCLLFIYLFIHFSDSLIFNAGNSNRNAKFEGKQKTVRLREKFISNKV